MRTKAVIFDVDGTLIDTNGLHSAAWVEAFKHFGVKVDPDDVRRQMGKGGDELMPSFLAPDLIEQRPRMSASGLICSSASTCPGRVRFRVCGSCSSVFDRGTVVVLPRQPRRTSLSITSLWPHY